MFLIDCLYYLIIRPLELLYEFVFSVSYKFFGNPVLSIILLSICVGFLSLPLYKHADKLQAEAEEVENKLKNWKSRIKKSFKGDEQIMMLQAYYRENNYHPLMIMRSSVSLLLQIPFFIAAFRMLSSCMVLRGASFGPIADLGAPDGMIRIGSLDINVLPVLMTLINIVSGTVYSKGKNIRSKVQLYLTAMVFLVILYGSPSGLVLYWTLNNVFSLFKNIFMKLIPFRGFKETNHGSVTKDGTVIFVLSSVSCSIFIGLYIPALLFEPTVGDFLSNYSDINLLHFLLISLLISFGIFTVWGGIYFFVTGKQFVINWLISSVLLVSIVDYLLFVPNNGSINKYLYYLDYRSNGFSDGINNALCLCVVVLAVAFVMLKFPRVIKYVLITLFVVIFSISVINTVKISRENKEYDFIKNQRDLPVLTLSADKPNVVVIMLDRATGRLTPYIMDEIPGLRERFDGFVYYDNSLSFAQRTLTGSGEVFGGYDYTPSCMNSRSDIPLVDKQNESLLVLPRLFGDNGYNVTVCNPSYAGYRFIPDLTIYDDYPNVNAYITDGAFNPYYDDIDDDWTEFMERNLFAYCLRCSSPVWLRDLLYDDGYYNDTNRRMSEVSYVQRMTDISHATGWDYRVLDPYYSLVSLSEYTTITDDPGAEGSFVMMVNNTVHEPVLFDEEALFGQSDYSLNYSVDNSVYDEVNSARFEVYDPAVQVISPLRMAQYQTQAAAYLALADWFDYLRAQGVYDNTRIILVSDHGSQLWMFGAPVDDQGNMINITNFNCLMMVKDFGAEGFTVSDQFITNAETPAIALDGIVNDPVNPFTGNPIVSRLGDADSFRYFSSTQFNPSDAQTCTFEPGDWFSYNPDYGNVYDVSAWDYQGTY